MATLTIGPLMRDWRTRRGRSQLDLSLDVGVSTRHLSFVETGKSRPSPELVLAVAEHLEVPLRERNTMLLAAGFAPRYSQRGLDAPAMRQIVVGLQRMLDAHDPYPGVVIDRQWNVVLANDAVTRPHRGPSGRSRRATRERVPAVSAPDGPRRTDGELRRMGRVPAAPTAPDDRADRRRRLAGDRAGGARLSERGRARATVEHRVGTSRRSSCRSTCVSTTR